MEFKKPTRHSTRQPKLDMLVRRPTPSNPHPVRHPAPVDDAHTPPATTPAQPPRVTPNTIDININFGGLSSKIAAIAQIRSLPVTKKTIVVASIILLVTTGIVIAGFTIRHHTVTNNTSDNSDPNKAIENLEYQTVLPEGKSISELGGWKRVSPPKSDPVFAYADKIGDTPISVSQQPLPESFKDNIDNQVAELAKKFNATTKIDAGSTKVYIGTSTKGPQSVILTKNNLLILIKSQKKIDDKSWTKYADSLN